MKKLYLSLALLLLSYLGYSQITFERNYGDIHYEAGNSVLQTSDGGYIIAGLRDINTVGNRAWLVRTDELGDTLWTKILGGSSWSVANSIATTDDGGYIITGSKGMEPNQDVLLYKTDVDGDTLWTRTFGGVNDDIGFDVVQTYDGGYMLTAFKTITSVDIDVYLIKTDANGYAEWEKTLGGLNLDAGYSIIQTSDSGFVIVGTTSYGIGDNDVYLIRTDVHGDTLWTRTYGGVYIDNGYAVEMTSDGGYIIAGLSNSTSAGDGDIYIIRTDALGDTLWTKAYGSELMDYATSVTQTSDGGFVLTGWSYRPTPLNFDVNLLKTNANGDSLWMCTFGSFYDDIGSCVKETDDGGLIITGSVQDTVDGNINMYLIKTGANGQLAGIDNIATASGTPLLIYPNPSSGNIRLQVPPDFGPIASIAVYNYLGALQFEQTGVVDEIDLSALNGGMYFVVVRNHENKKLMQEVIRE